VLAISRDTTERRELEERYRQAHKLEAVGRLAGGVAHDFNNLLSVILGYDELLLKRLPPGEPLRQYAQVIHNAVDRSAELVRQLLAFGRQQTLRPQVLDVREVVHELEGMLRRVIREDIELVCRTSPDLGRVCADPGQIGQVIMNLAVNARDAMPDGGTLTIEAVNVDVPPSGVPGAALKEGPYLRLSVRDTGCGMDASTCRRIFEPFFTTKERGKGSGLGLATVYGIVQQSGGCISVDSEPGQGSTFSVWLPRTFSEPVPAVPVRSRLPRTGSETVLVVEDEDAMREAVRDLLEDQGYRVITAPSGPAALDLARRHPGRIDVLLTDVIMQQMNGRELAERMRRLRPEAAVLFMSGYADDTIARYGVLEPGIALLQKPFSAEELGDKVREVLGAGALSAAC
jgi:nitrogen-specific signal transduction histidine kinase/CheY-like chemotaxis protein